MRHRRLPTIVALSLFWLGPAAADEISKIDELKAQIIAIENAGKLDIGYFARCTAIGGFGQCAEASSTTVAKGANLKFYYEPRNVHTKHDETGYQRWFKQDMIVRDKSGKELLRQDGALDLNYKTKKPVFDIFVTNNLNLGDLAPGSYEFEIVVHDQLSEQSVSYVYKFDIGS